MSNAMIFTTMRRSGLAGKMFFTWAYVEDVTILSHDGTNPTVKVERNENRRGHAFGGSFIATATDRPSITHR